MDESGHAVYQNRYAISHIMVRRPTIEQFHASQHDSGYPTFYLFAHFGSQDAESLPAQFT
eukprot:5265470-Pyramimonas_sp.AAC.1